MNSEYIFEINDALYDHETGKVCMMPKIVGALIRCKDCKFAHMTYDGKCKYCDIWFPDEKTYMDGEYFCASAERRSDE